MLRLESTANALRKPLDAVEAYLRQMWASIGKDAQLEDPRPKNA